MTLAKLLSALPPAMWDSLFSRKPLATLEVPFAHTRRQASEARRSHGVFSEEDFYKDLVSHWKKPTNLVIGSEESASVFWNLDSLPRWKASNNG